jgi:hypothetical protein
VVPSTTSDGPLGMYILPIEDKYGNINPRTWLRPVGAGSGRPLVDGKKPQLRLIEYTSDNKMDSKVSRCRLNR